MRSSAILLIISIFAVSEVRACPEKVFPYHLGREADNYSSVFVGRVRDVYLSGRKLREVAQEVYENPNELVGDVEPASLLTIAIIENIRGDNYLAQQLFVGGCGISPPKIGAIGIFFVGENGFSAIPVYETDNSFDQWVARAKEVEVERGHSPIPSPPVRSLR